MFSTILATGQPIVLVVLFWILLILTAIGALYPFPDQARAGTTRATWIVVLILIGILGYVALGNPAH
jgi:uncharacterized membrane protein YkvI